MTLAINAPRPSALQNAPFSTGQSFTSTSRFAPLASEMKLYSPLELARAPDFTDKSLLGARWTAALRDARQSQKPAAAMAWKQFGSTETPGRPQALLHRLVTDWDGSQA